MPDLQKLQRFIAICAISISALRNQGIGSIQKARAFCGGLSLIKYGQAKNRKDYIKLLDDDTVKLAKLINPKKKPWGTARKALNLFMRDCLYNRYLSEHFHLTKLEDFLEIPLDSAVSKGLRNKAGRGYLPKWPGLIGLKKPASEVYQKFAQEIADKRKISRVHLDLELWLENR